MTNLTEATPRTYRGETMGRATYDAGGTLYEGSAVQLTSAGKLENATGAGTTFAGFADGSTSADGDRLTCLTEGTVSLTGVAKASSWDAGDVGEIVYMTDGNTFTLVSTSAQDVGRVIEIDSFSGTSATVWVAFTSLGMLDHS